MAGFRFSLATYNLWATARWPEREPALRKFAQEIAPDILAVQELRPETQALLDEELKGHRRIADPFDGWTWEGNIYWDTGLFDLEDYGAEDVGIFPARAFPLAAERKSRPPGNPWTLPVSSLSKLASPTIDITKYPFTHTQMTDSHQSEQVHEQPLGKVGMQGRELSYGGHSTSSFRALRSKIRMDPAFTSTAPARCSSPRLRPST